MKKRRNQLILKLLSKKADPYKDENATWPEKFYFSIYTSYAHGVFGNPITLFRFRHLKIDFE